MKRNTLTGLIAALACGVFPATASADLLTFTGTGANLGLSAKAEFTRIDATTLKVVLTNTSTSLPSHMAGGDSSANRLLTSLAFRLPGTTNLTGGTAAVTAGSLVDNYAGNVNGTNLGKEWGWGWNGTGQCCEGTDPGHTYNDWVSTLSAGTNQFKAGSLDQSDLNGPKWGLASNALPSSHESVRNSATFMLNLSGGIPDLSFLANGAVVEFGSDAAFLTSTLVGPPPPGAPEPAALLLLGIGVAGWARHRRKK